MFPWPTPAESIMSAFLFLQVTFDSTAPKEAMHYLHLSGRVGRLGRSGTALSILTNEELRHFYRTCVSHHAPTATDISLRERHPSFGTGPSLSLSSGPRGKLAFVFLEVQGAQLLYTPL